MKYFISSLLAFCLSITAFTAFSQVVNDECTGAILLDPTPTSSDCRSGSTQFATPSAYPTGCCGPVTNDVWYKFTADQANYTISLGSADNPYFPGTNFSYFVEVYSGTCNSLQRLTENNIYNPSSIYLTNLVEGDTYYFRIYGTDVSYDILFNFCLIESDIAVNDECNTAIEVIPTNEEYCSFSYVVNNLSSATQSLPPCSDATYANDVWYKFIATSPSHIVSINNFYGSELDIELFSGSCGSLTSIKCTNTQALPVHVFQGLTIGDEYYLRFSNDQFVQNYFTFCVTTLPLPPVNDDCSTALPLPVNEDVSCGNQLSASTVGALNSSTITCLEGENHDIWYTFTATGTQVYIEAPIITGQSIGNNFKLGYALYEGDCLQPEQACGITYSGSFTLSGLAVGTVYYLKLFTEEGSGHAFSICARVLPDLPQNTYCTTAEFVTVNEPESCNTIIHGSTLGASNANLPYNSCVGGPVLWYQFTAPSNACLFKFQNIQTLLNLPELYLGVYGGNCDTLSSLACSNVTNGSVNYINGLTPGENYYFSISSQLFSGSIFDLCIEAVDAPSNDDCATSIEIPVNNELECISSLSCTTLGSGLDSEVSCWEQPTVWYSFTPTQNAYYLNVNSVQTVEQEHISSNIFSYSVFQGTCGQLSMVKCNAWTYGNEIILSDLVPGIPCYIALGASSQNTALTFDLCLLTPPASPSNDACYGATALVVNSGTECAVTTEGTTLNATSSPVNQSSCTSMSHDVWYTFVATQSNHEIVLSNIVNTQNAPTSYLGGEVFSGTCGQLQLITSSCFFQEGIPVLASGLIVGNIYYVRVFPNYYNGAYDSNFNICVTTPTAPLNDYCEGAFPLAINTDMACTLITSGSTYAATSSNPNSCGQPLSSDLWYTFEASSSNYRIELINTYDYNSSLRNHAAQAA